MNKNKISIVIATFNRREELESTLFKLFNLEPQADEIIVYLDGCTDDSEAMIRERFPSVITIVSSKPGGSIPARDTAFRRASGNLIVSLDDDSFPMQRDFVKRVRLLMDRHPEAGAFAFHEVRSNGPRRHLSRSNEPATAWIGAYPNCAGAIRKDLYGRTVSYPVFFKNGYEEPDICLQIYSVGYGVLYEPEIKIFHAVTPTLRNLVAKHHRQARNEFWSVVMRCPMPHILWLGPYRILRQILYGITKGLGWFLLEPKWVFSALWGIRLPLSERKPVPWAIYWQWVKLARNPLEGSKEALTKKFPNIALRLTRAGDQLR